MENKKTFRRIYVWQLAVRVFHWLNVLAIIVLILTGFLIANPPALLIKADASELYMMGTTRLIHFLAAYLFLFVMILRLYWAIIGNRFARWTAFMPFNKKVWENIKHVLKIDILLMNEKAHDPQHISVGHNSIATISYLVMFFMALVQIFTGFGLYSDTSEFWLPNLFSWVNPMFGGDFATRQIHHISMWIFIFFTMVHIYLVFYHDWLEGRGEASSMISGYKFVGSGRVKGKKKSSNKESEKN
ncbi:MAG: Ni/Fe-hydrogenase, b-type cytochrome subunit [Flavobacteriaceae bacterium]|nr:Ni/Fe-hydrogenase, b-type cytochrome subunit [Flavobacteriaceae bacterium]